MKKFLVAFLFLLSVYLANAYEGLYLVSYIGINATVDLDNLYLVKANPYSSVSQSLTNVDAAYDFDIGYTFFKVPLSIAVGFELNNWVEPNVRLVLKYNFRADKLLFPYVYITGHGGLVDLLSYGIHAGGGLDIQINEWYFIGIDARAGYESTSKVQNNISSNLKVTDFSNEIETTLSIGMGVKIPTKKFMIHGKKKKRKKAQEI